MDTSSYQVSANGDEFLGLEILERMILANLIYVGVHGILVWEFWKCLGYNA